MNCTNAACSVWYALVVYMGIAESACVVYECKWRVALHAATRNTMGRAGFLWGRLRPFPATVGSTSTLPRASLAL